jgi:hypothetical protein
VRRQAGRGVNAAEQMPELTDTSFSSPRPNNWQSGGNAIEISSLWVQPYTAPNSVIKALAAAVMCWRMRSSNGLAKCASVSCENARPSTRMTGHAPGGTVSA